jgi:hypothetical protein
MLARFSALNVRSTAALPFRTLVATASARSSALRWLTLARRRMKESMVS